MLNRYIILTYSLCPCTQTVVASSEFISDTILYV